MTDTSPPTVNYDLHDQSLGPVLQDVLRGFRESCPIARTEANGGHWVVSSYGLVEDVLMDTKSFSSFPASVEGDLGQKHKMIPLEIDPPEHGGFRRILTPLFSARRMKELESQVRSITNELIDAFANNEGCDFVRSFARPLPARVFLALMGWPQDEADRLLDIVEDIHRFGVEGEDDSQLQQIRSNASSAAHAFFEEIVKERRSGEHRDDATTTLLNAEYEGRRLEDDELYDMMYILLIGGLLTVQSTLAHGMIWFADHPEIRTSLVADPSLMPGAVQELLRWEPPAQPARRALCPVEVGGVHVETDDLLILAVPSANRDPNAFSDPESFRLDRARNPHLAFGAGIHRCVGANLALVELRVAFEEINRRFASFRIDPEYPVGLEMRQSRGVHSLHVIFEPRLTDT